jgi:hypothetical protein
MVFIELRIETAPNQIAVFQDKWRFLDNATGNDVDDFWLFGEFFSEGVKK